MLDWDTALSHHGNSLMAARIAMYDEGLWVDLFRASRALRQYAEQHADQRQASANLKLVVGTIFSPLLQELYLQHEAHAFVAELLRTLGECFCSGLSWLTIPPSVVLNLARSAVSLGRDHPEIICQMADEGIFYVLSVMALYPPTSEVTLASLAKLANCEGQAGWEAQVIASVHQQGFQKTIRVVLHAKVLTSHGWLHRCALPTHPACRQSHYLHEAISNLQAMSMQNCQCMSILITSSIVTGSSGSSCCVLSMSLASVCPGGNYVRRHGAAPCPTTSACIRKQRYGC